MRDREIFDLMRMVYKNVRCPQCGQRYLFSDIKIRGMVVDFCFLELNCPGHMPLIATVTIKKQPEVKFNQEEQVIRANDVIETHKFLKTFKGGFEERFKNK